MTDSFHKQIIVFSLALDTAAGHTGNDVLAGEEEDDDHRNDDDRRGCHHSFVSLTAFGHKGIKTKRQCSDFLGVGGDHRPQEGVPGRDRIEQDYRCQ